MTLPERILVDPNEPPGMQEIELTYQNLTNVAIYLQHAIQAMPNAARVWECINTLESMGEQVDERNPRVDTIIRAAANSLDDLRAAYGILNDVVETAEAFLKGEQE